MSNEFPAGEYQARASSVAVVTNRFNTECAAIEFEVTEGAMKGRVVRQEYEFSDQRFEKTVAVLERLGWRRTGLAPEVLAQECTNPVTIRVRYFESNKINPKTNTPYVNMAVDVEAAKVALTGGALSALEQRLRNAGQMGNAPVVLPTSRPQASSAGGADDIPF